MTASTSPREVTWSTFGQVASPMGLQHYESELLAAMRKIDDPRWTLRPRRFTSLRDPGPADVRMPARLLGRAPASAARAIGALAHRGLRRVHRFDLRLPPPTCPEVVTVHDLPPLRFSDEGELPNWSLSSARRARLVICPSDFAAEEVRDLLGVSRTVVIPNGAAACFDDPDPFQPADLEAHGVRAPFVLHAGGASQRKNLVELARAWGAASPSMPDHTLVLVGPPDQRRDDAFAGIGRVVKVGYLPPPVVARLMASAELVVVPSTYEGFGLPALEAMSAGTAVVASARGALPEVCGDAATLVDPTASNLADAIVGVCEDPTLREAMVKLGRERARAFSWERSAQAHLDAYANAFD